MDKKNLGQVATATCALALLAGQGLAGGIDRSGQGVNILFEEGNYAQFTLSRVNPDVNGSEPLAAPGSGTSTDVAKRYNNLSFGYKHALNDKIDLAIIYDEPFGAHVHYTTGPLSGGGFAGLPFDGLAEIDSKALTGLIQYKFDNGFSVHAGVRAQSVEGVIQSSPGILQASSDYDFGGVFGIAYQKPEIALRVALTYSTAIDNGFTGTRTTLGATPVAFEVEMPESINLDFQTGVAANTLVFGSIRWVGWGGFNLTTPGNVNWVNFTDDTTTYTLGIGRKINEKLSVALRFGYESAGVRPSTSALSPTTGSKSVGLGVTYHVNEKLSISGGITYAVPGDQSYELVTGVPVSAIQFNDNKAIGGGIRIGYRF